MKRETLQELITREQRQLARREWWLTVAMLAVVGGWWCWCVWEWLRLATGG